MLIKKGMVFFILFSLLYINILKADDVTEKDTGVYSTENVQEITVPWQHLRVIKTLRYLEQKLKGELVVVKAIEKYSCKPLTLKSIPTRKIIQIIENTYYEWDEFESYDQMGGLLEFCIRLKIPEETVLTAYEAQILLSGSSLWQKEQTIQIDPVIQPERPSILSPDDPLLKNLKPLGDDSSHKRTIQGIDERVKVPSTYITQYPWDTIAFSAIWSDENTGSSSYRGTAFMVGPYVALTCGHNIYIADDDTGYCHVDGFASQVDLSPAQYQSYQGASVVRNYGTRESVRVGTNTSYKNIIDSNCNDNNRFQYDYGAVFIDEPFSQVTTYMPLLFDYTPTFINVAGYPGSAGSESVTYSMWRSASSVDGSSNRQIFYGADTSGGMSGSPVWVYSSSTGQRQAVGIHCMGGGSYNGATRFISQNYDLISDWLQWTPDSSGGTIEHTLTAPTTKYVQRGGTAGPFSSSTVNSTEDTYYLYSCVVTPMSNTICIKTQTVSPGDTIYSTNLYLSIPPFAIPGTTYYCEYVYDSSSNLIDTGCFDFYVVSNFYPASAHKEWKLVNK